MVFADKDFSIPGLVMGDVLDGHENAYIRYGYVPDVYPILSCHEYVCAHSHIDMSEEEYKKGVPALWKKDNLLVCSFRLCNFRHARLAPRRSFEALVAAVTDIRTLDKEKLSSKRAGQPCAHFNSYYHAVLLLAYRAGGDKRYLEIAERGLAFLMSHYPETNRETSETEENCRLLFPLAVLYEITGKAEHYEWICRIMDYLDEHRHACGAIPEWDTGYKANCARNHTGECALLANNGDPVADLLYSNNWLPLGFAYAYFATGEERFRKAWCETASFLFSCQMYSEDKLLDGAWTRAFDIEAWESYGVPHDAGWAPCCIETGWTLGEILMGLQFMEQAEKLRADRA